jgi:nucleotide-binding universal stress UspA family protein
MTTSPQPLQTILVPTDFSEDASAAVGWAAEVARERSARLLLVHAALVATPMGQEFIPLHERFYADLRAQAKEQLVGLASALRESELVVETELVDEPAAASILAAAEKHRADLIVAGTRGLTGWKRAILGSVAARLVRRASCPVVTVHAGDPGRAPVRTILVPTDFSEDATVAVGAASRILGEGGPDRRLVLLHVYRQPVIFAQASKPVFAASVEEVIVAARREMSVLAGRFSRDGIRVETRIDEGQPWEVIPEHARQVGAQLIAMGTHGRSGFDRLFLGSTAERVLAGAPCPVLTVRAAASSEAGAHG